MTTQIGTSNKTMLDVFDFANGHKELGYRLIQRLPFTTEEISNDGVVLVTRVDRPVLRDPMKKGVLLAIPEQHHAVWYLKGAVVSTVYEYDLSSDANRRLERQDSSGALRRFDSLRFVGNEDSISAARDYIELITGGKLQ